MLSIRCNTSCPDTALIRQQLGRVHPAVRIVDVGPLENEYLDQLARPRAAAALGFTFATVGSLAAAGGLFAVLTYAVGRKRREFGIRAAVGASPKQIGRAVLLEGLTVALIGVALGAAGAASLGGVLSSLQYGINATDPVSLALMILLITTTILAASWRPARQAMRIDPIEVLREE